MEVSVLLIESTIEFFLLVRRSILLDSESMSYLITSDYKHSRTFYRRLSLSEKISRLPTIAIDNGMGSSPISSGTSGMQPEEIDLLSVKRKARASDYVQTEIAENRIIFYRNIRSSRKNFALQTKMK